MKLLVGLMGFAIVGASVAYLRHERVVTAERHALKQSVAALGQAQEAESRRVQRLQRETVVLRNVANQAHEGEVEFLQEPESHRASEAVDAGDQSQSEAPGSAPGSVSVERLLSTMESAFEKETADGSAFAKAAAIEAAARPLLEDRGTIESVECRASFCRLRSVQPDMDQYQRFATGVARSGICKECFYTRTGETPDGRSILTVYIARDGADLPRPE
jgi:hypothetical protein